MADDRVSIAMRRSSLPPLQQPVINLVFAVGLWVEREKTSSSGELDKCISLANDARALYLCVFSSHSGVRHHQVPLLVAERTQKDGKPSSLINQKPVRARLVIQQQPALGREGVELVIIIVRQWPVRDDKTRETFEATEF